MQSELREPDLLKSSESLTPSLPGLDSAPRQSQKSKSEELPRINSGAYFDCPPEKKEPFRKAGAKDGQGDGDGEALIVGCE